MGAEALVKNTEVKENIPQKDIVSEKAKIQEFLSQQDDGKWGKITTNDKTYYSFTKQEGTEQKTYYIDKNTIDNLCKEDETIANYTNKMNIFATTLNTNQETNELEAAIRQKQLYEKTSSLLVQYNKLKDGIDGERSNKKVKKQLETRLNNSIHQLEKIKNDIAPETGYQYNNLAKHEQTIATLTANLGKYEEVRQTIVIGERTDDIPTNPLSTKDAKNLKNFEKDYQKYMEKMAKILKEPALSHLLGCDQQELANYFNEITNGNIEPSTHPFYAKHKESFALIQEVSPQLYGHLVPKREGQVVYNTYCQRDPQLYQQQIQSGKLVCPQQNQTAFNRIGTMIADAAEGVGLNKDNDPRKRQAWEKAGGIVALGGAVVLGFKFLQNLFSSKKNNPDKRRNVGLFGGGLLALLNADKLVNRVQDITGRHPAEKTRMMAESFKTYGFSNAEAIKTADKYIGAPVTTLSALHFIPMYELESQKILQNNNGEFEFNYSNYETYVNKFKRDKAQKDTALAAGKKLDENKCIGDGLKAFGITTRDQFKGLFGSDKKKTLAQTTEVQNGWTKAVERVQHGVNKDLFKNGFRAKDPDTMDRIMKEYDENNGSANVDALIKKRINEGLLEFTEDRTYSIEQLKTDINLERMTLNGFKDNQGHEIKFNTYGELLDAANLTKWIGETFKNRPAKGIKNGEGPFYINVGCQIAFNDADRDDVTKKDTSVVKFLTLKEHSTLYNNKDDFIRLLNEQRAMSLGKE